jgi:hypothetical protein
MANCISLTFVSQKRGQKNVMITQLKTYDKILCPILQWATIVHRILCYNGTTPDTPVSAIWEQGRIEPVSSKHVKNAPCNGIMVIGEPTLCIYHHEVGTHSIRAGATMAMYLGRVPIFTIMLIGHWSCTAFINYIRKQNKEFTFNVSTLMLSVQQF